MTIHDLDMARFFVPDIVEVFAVGSAMFDAGARDNGDFDSAVTTLRSASGVVVTIINSRHSVVGYDQRLEAFGSDGVLEVVNRPSSLVRRSTVHSVGSGSPFESFFLQRYATAYAAELRAFVHLVRGDDVAVPGFEDGHAALLLADAAQRSAERRVAVGVDLD
ncbi:hypothetical protein GCM10025865_13990 [Paraoerskovia sediminicola]|uniref:GFO/IDH/MocA-like oxidoreductase domain-containing protein n=1 Tax=Paraoerskovia sediminicola TaxID=1138587 RepID=A0ABM8G214_9CELL|nr:hypothetical protein GCM10025865_13990 [Paraoerskovia sediminicola]